MAIGSVLNFDIQQDSLELYKIFADMEVVKESLGTSLFSLSLSLSLSLYLIFFHFFLHFFCLFNLINHLHVGIEEYCLSQTSLEQVFLRFALEQEDEEEGVHK